MCNCLKTILRLNSLSCIGFGFAFALAPESIGSFLDGIPPVILHWIGIGLALNGFHLVIDSFRKKIGKFELGYFIVGDLLWVLSSIILTTLVSEVIYSPPAIATTLAVALLVGSFAALQIYWGRSILTSSRP